MDNFEKHFKSDKGISLPKLFEAPDKYWNGKEWVLVLNIRIWKI